MPEKELKKLNNMAVIGIDAGGTKTEGVLASIQGKILFQHKLRCGNYQSIGIRAAEQVILSILTILKNKANESGFQIGAICYGMAGFDRKKDRDVIETMIQHIDPERPKIMVNDTFLILRAGTIDGVGVAVVSGTGPNTVGKNNAGDEWKVGGLTFELGDFGGGMDIAREAIIRARRGKDGRNKPTVLEQMIITKFNLKEIEDILDRFIWGGENSFDLSQITPLVFMAAKQKDEAARQILMEAGMELGLCARLVAKKLFKQNDKINLVLGGSVLQQGEDSIMRETLVKQLKKEFPHVKVIKLSCPPVLGGIFYAIDILKQKRMLPDDYIWPDAEIQAKF